MIFRKGKKSGRRRAEVDPYANPTPSEEPSPERLPDRPGPYDAEDVDADASHTGRYDFGSVQVRPVTGTQLAVHWEQNVPRAIVVQTQDSALDLRPFAAPRSSDIWEDLRPELAADANRQGAMVSERRGPYGVELEVAMPTRSADGRHGTQMTRLFGVDGPRWFLRVQIFGAAVRDAEAAKPLHATLADVVVVRGGAPMAPRESLPLSVPEHLMEGGEDQPGQQGQPNQQGQQSQQGRQGPQGQQGQQGGQGPQAGARPR